MTVKREMNLVTHVASEELIGIVLTDQRQRSSASC